MRVVLARDPGNVPVDRGVACALGLRDAGGRPEVVTTRETCVDIELRGALTRGRTVAWDPAESHSMSAGLDLPEVRRVRIADGVDNDESVRHLLERPVR